MGPSQLPVLLAVAHGTRNPEGPATVAAILDDVRARRPELEVVESYVELNAPLFADVVTGLARDAVAVPLLLSQGFHTKVDLPGFAEAASAPVRQTPALGPDPLLAEALLGRLEQAGLLHEAGPEQGIVLIAAGSSDPAGRADVVAMAELLSRVWGGAVEAAFLTGEGPDVAQAQQRLVHRGASRTVAAPYLLAPGFFLTQAQQRSAAVGSEGCAGPLANHPLLIEVIVRRYAAATQT